MFESKYNKLLTVVLIIVILAIIGLLGFLAVNYFLESNSTQEAADFVKNYDQDDLVLDDNKENNNDTKTGDNNNQNPEDDSDPLADLVNKNKEQNGDSGDNGNDDGNNGGSGNSGNGGNGGNGGSSTPVKKKTEYKGYTVGGTMKIPKINFQYPVLEKVSKSSLENSVAILYGAGLNQVGNTVIIGHNYRNGQFFSNNKKLSNGDKIYITDYEGNTKTYSIYNKFETTPEDTSFYQRDTNGKAEVTLSTCTDDSKARLIIFAKEV